MRRRTTRGAAGREAYHHGNLRRALLDAALEILGGEGAGALSLREAARRAGVSHAAPFRHFADKQDLVAAVAEEGFRAMTAEMRAATPPGLENPVARLQALGVRYVTFAAAHPAHFRVMFGPEVADRRAHSALRAAADEAFELLVGALADCQRAGMVRAGEPSELAMAAWATVHGLASLVVSGQISGEGSAPRGSVEELALRVTASLFRGLMAEPATPGGGRPTGAGPAQGRTAGVSTGMPRARHIRKSSRATSSGAP